MAADLIKISKIINGMHEAAVFVKGKMFEKATL